MMRDIRATETQQKVQQPYFLDTNVLLRYPDLLSRRSRHPLKITDTVLGELANLKGRRSDVHDIIRLVDDATRQQLISIDPVDGRIDQSLVNSPRLSTGDALQLTHLLKKQADRPIFVTDDHTLLQTAIRHGINAVTTAGIIDELRREPIASSEIYGKSRKIVQLHLTHLVLSLLASMCLGALVAFIAYNITWIIERINLIGVAIALPLVGSTLFYIRGRNPITYGGAEIFVGIATGLNAFLGQQHGMLDTTTALQIMAGTYIIVRGLDNLGKGLRRTRLQPLWDRIFPSQ